MSKEIDLEKIVEVPLNNHFPLEDIDFTPWLAEYNIFMCNYSA